MPVLIKERHQQACAHRHRSDMTWTQDGWVSVCLDCEAWLYYGDGPLPARDSPPLAQEPQVVVVEPDRSGGCLGTFLLVVVGLVMML